MFPYTGKYTESEYDIQNNNLLYKLDQHCQNTLEHIEIFEHFRKTRKQHEFQKEKCYIYIYIYIAPQIFF